MPPQAGPLRLIHPSWFKWRVEPPLGKSFEAQFRREQRGVNRLLDRISRPFGSFLRSIRSTIAVLDRHAGAARRALSHETARDPTRGAAGLQANVAALERRLAAQLGEVPPRSFTRQIRSLRPGRGFTVLPSTASRFVGRREFRRRVNRASGRIRRLRSNVRRLWRAVRRR